MSNLWIPGWQFAETVFDPLRTFLEESTPQVLSYASADQDWSSWCDAQLSRIPQGARLIGWSLGGMLACELARRSDRVSSVLVLQANTRFSGGPGLPEAVAEGFRHRYARHPDATRARFSALVAPEHPVQVQDHLLPGLHDQTLDWLYEIDVQNGPGSVPVDVLLSRQDRLVPCESARDSWLAVARSVEVIDGCHGAPLISPALVADWVVAHG